MVIGQGHTYLKPEKLLEIQISSFILTEGVHIRAPRGFGDLGRMTIYFQGAGEHW